MKQRLWVILGASSIIAEQFAHLAAGAGYSLCLVGRDEEQLAIISQDISLRYQVPCSLFVIDMKEHLAPLLTYLMKSPIELDLFIAHSDFTENNALTAQTINQLITVNVLATVQIIHCYLNLQQRKHHLVYLSSVAACRGRAKNSLYGGSKAAIEGYLQGLQQIATKNQHITIARLGFIDTKQTYGVPGIFYNASPKDCAKACWQGIQRKKSLIYYPSFWRAIMAIIIRIPSLQAMEGRRPRPVVPGSLRAGCFAAGKI